MLNHGTPCMTVRRFKRYSIKADGNITNTLHDSASQADILATCDNFRVIDVIKMIGSITIVFHEKARFTVLDQNDGWTVRTRDQGLSAQFEHTILMTEDGPEILTTTKLGPQLGHTF